jgi:tetratricopeptide (TPR) repeat protein
MMQPMTGFEHPLSDFFFGVSQKCFVVAIQKWKETKDKIKADEETKTIHEFESAKSAAVKVQQRITVAIRGLHLSAEQLQQVLALEKNPLLKDELAAQFLNASITPEHIVEYFVNQDSSLLPIRDQLLLIATAWMDEIDRAIAEDSVLSNILTIKAHRDVRSSLKSLENQLVKRELKDDQNEEAKQQRLNEMFAKVSDIQSSMAFFVSKEREDKTPENLKSLYQRRFDKAKERLAEGKVVVAEQGFRELLDELQTFTANGEAELKLRCHLNIATCLWEQNKIGDSADWFEKSFALNPNDWRAKRGKAFALIHRNSIEPALEILRQIRKERPDESEHVCNEAWILKNTGRVQAAIELLESRVFEDENYFSILSFAYSRADRRDEAERAARKAIQIAPKSDVALMALSFALGFPVIQRRTRRETLQFTPSDDERKRLTDAIGYAEQAAASLRSNGRINSLVDVLSNLTAFYPAVGNCNQAIIFAKEALQYAQNDVNILRNLWCAQMRVGQFSDAILTAEKLEILDNPVDWWKRKSEAQILADKSQEVLNSWEAKKSDSQFSADVDAIAIVAGAYSKRHRTDDGLGLLNDALTRDPSNPALLTQRGLLLEGLGKISEARNDFDNAEKSPANEYRGQMILDFGQFLFRRHEWKEAAERFKTLGGESVHNPLFTNYLICLFNQGEYRQCLALAEVAIKETKDFVEDYYAIAARCYHICDNLPRAKELLDTLVGMGTSRELEHRKLLAWVYWRMDDLPQAFDVLLKCLKIDTNDLDALMLQSAVCSILGKHEEALECGRKASELAPESIRAHTALVSAAFACPQDFKIKQEHLDAHFRSLAFLQQTKSGILQAIPVEPDLHSILDMVKTRSKEIRKFEDYYIGHPLPMGAFANRIGRSLFQTWAALMQHARLKVRVAFGTTDEQQDEIRTVTNSESVSIDLFALLSLHHLNLLHLLPKMFKHVFVHSSLLDVIVIDLRDIQQHPEGLGIAYVDGKYIRHERNPEQNRVATAFLTELRDFLKSPSVELTGLLPESLKANHAKDLVDACGIASIAPLLVAREKSVPIFSDDAYIKAIGRLEDRTPGFCIQAFLRVAAQKSLITPTEYQDAVIKLIKCNYAFISEDASVLNRCYQAEKGRISPFALSLLNRVNDRQYETRSCLPLLGEFAVYLWRNKEPEGANTREEWLGEIWLALSKAKDSESLILEYIAHLVVACPTQPAVFFGIINNALFQASFVHRQRVAVFTIVKGAVATMHRMIKELYPYWPGLSAEWLQHQKVNDILARQGFFDRGIAEGFTPAESATRQTNKKSRKAFLKSKRRLKKRKS